MKIIQLNKSMETIKNLKMNEYNKIYFLALKLCKTRSGTENYTFNSKRLDYIMFRDLDEYLNNPEYILVKIEKEEESK